MLQRAEIADLAAKGEKIPLSHLPDALRKQYEAAWKKAEESYDPAQAKRNLNGTFRQHADNYLAELAKGDDPNSIMMVAKAESDLRGVDDDISDWMAKDENEPILKEARTQAREALKSNAAYRAASKEDKQVIAAETFRTILRSLSADLDEKVREYRNELESELAKNERERSVKGRDLAGAYDKGAEPNGKKYNTSLERAMKAKGKAFDRAEFDRQWDAKFWHPHGRAIQAHPSSPMGQSHPYSTPVWEQ
jgi:hypothetical protein